MDKNPSRTRGMIWCGLLIGFLGLIVSFWRETPEVLKTVTELVKVLNPDTPQIQENKVSREVSRIIGTWQSDTSGKMYDVMPNSVNAFTFSERVNGRAVPVGIGVITNNNISIEYTSPTKGRSAVLRLSVSEDGNVMSGSMQGKDSSETGLLRFKKVAVG